MLAFDTDTTSFDETEFALAMLTFAPRFVFVMIPPKDPVTLRVP